MPSTVSATAHQASSPFFSILLSVFNDERYLPEALDSMLNQAFRDFECVAINDGSTDTSATILDTYAATDPRLRVFHRPNQGLTLALNFAASQARGRYLARLDSDDLWHPDKLSLQYQYVQEHPDCALLGTGYAEIDTDGSFLQTARVPLLTEDSAIRNALPRFNPFFHSSIVLRKMVFDHVGQYDPRFRYAQDYQLWVRVISAFPCANLRQTLAFRRITGQNVSFRQERRQKLFALRARLLAISVLQQPRWQYVLLLNDIAVMLLPRSVTSLIRNMKYKLRPMSQISPPSE